MINGFNMNGEPSPTKQETGLVHNIAELNDFSDAQIQFIDAVLNKMGKDLENLKNFFIACKEDGIDTAEFVERLSILSKAETSEELKKLIEEWWSKVF